MADVRTLYPTNNRRTVVNFDVGGVTVQIPAHRITREGKNIINGILPGMPLPQEVGLFTSGWWTSANNGMFKWMKNTITWETHTLREADVEAGPWIKENPQYRHPSSDLDGVVLPGGIQAEGQYAFEKEVPAGEDWTSELTVDEPEPPAGEQTTTQVEDVSTRRALQAIESFRANQGFLLGFSLPEGVSTRQTLFVFYFGGQTPVMPLSESGGRFCLRVKGDGVAILYEFRTSTAGFVERHRFKWAETVGGTGGYHEIGIMPHERDYIEFITKEADYDAGPATYLDFIIASMEAQKKPWGRSLYEETIDVVGHKHAYSMTGAGNCLLDLAEDFNHPFSITKVFYPEDGKIVTGMFQVPDMPQDTPLSLTWRWYGHDDTSITAQMFDGTTHAALGVDIDGYFLSNLGQRNYYAILTLHASPDQYASPILQSVTLKSPSFSHTEPADIKTGGIVREVNVTGPDLFPDHDSASLTIKDVRNEIGELLTKRGRITTQIDIVEADDPEEIVTRLFEGETGKIRGRRKVNASGRGFSNLWMDFDNAPFVGVWARLADQVNLGIMDFSKSDELDAFRKQLPYRVTVLVRELLNAAGFNDSQIIIPTYLDPIRLYPSATAGKDYYTLLPGKSYINVLHRLIRETLGHYMVWDPNSGVLPLNPGGGAWRILPNPTANSLEVWNFVTAKPESWGSSPKLTYVSESYGVNTSPIYQNTYFEECEPPEFNYISVSAAGFISPNKNGNWFRYSNALQNRPSIFGSRDPEVNPDYLGRYVPVHIVDAAIGGGSNDPAEIQRLVNIATYRYFFYGAFARHRKCFSAPLMPVWGDGDNYQLRKRPIRVNDIIKVDGVKHIVRSAEIAYNDDKHQQIHIDCYKARFG
jgi:hypothetical protein